MSADSARLTVAVGSDHAGVDVKAAIVAELSALGHSAVDVGPSDTKSVDYPDYAFRVADLVASGEADRGVLVCGTGLGMMIAANKVSGIRAAILYDETSARFSRLHNDANVAVFGARTMTVADILHRLHIFLDESFEGGRHGDRLGKIRKVEEGL